MAGNTISWAWKIIFVFLPASICLSGEFRQSLYQLLPNGYNVYLQDGIQAGFKSFKSGTRVQCALSCMNQEFCHLWRIDNGYCHMFHSFLDKVTVNTTTDPNQLTYYELKEVNNWIEVYFLKSESNFETAPSFLGRGTYTSWGPASCTQTFCKDFFRSLLIDIWSYLPIKKVKLSLLQNNTEILSVIFDGQGTDSTSWFNMSHVLKAPWKDVYSGAWCQYFTLDYYSLRSFYMAKYQRGCTKDVGWLTVIEKKPSCTWDTQAGYPYFLYSATDYATRWESGYSTAEAMAIYISI